MQSNCDNMDLVRRSSRLKSTKTTFSPSIHSKTRNRSSTAVKEVHKVAYKLDKNKAMKQQIEASERTDNVDIKLTSGNLVIIFSSAAYLEFKAVTLNYLASKKLTLKGKDTEARTDDEEDKPIVSECYTVLHENTKLFVMNFYNSTCKLVLNGNQNHISKFIEDFLSDVLTLLDRNTLFHEINKTIRACCENYLTQSRPKNNLPQQKKKSKKLSVQTVPTCDNTKEGPQLLQTISAPSNKFPLCPICLLPCDNEPTSIGCDKCDKWLHFSCEGITKTEIDNLPEKYHCKTCTMQINSRKALSSPQTQTLESTYENSSDLSSTQGHSVRNPTKQNSTTIMSLPCQTDTESRLVRPITSSIYTNMDTSPPSNISQPSTPCNALNEAEIRHLKSTLDQKEKQMRVKDNKILKYEAEIVQLKKQLSTNRSYTITIEEKNKDLQQSLLIANQRIDQLENNQNINNNNSAHRQEKSASSEMNEMKIWFLEQKLRQVELDVHKNNTELLILKNNSNTYAPLQQHQTQNKSRTRRRRRRHNNSSQHNDDTAFKTESIIDINGSYESPNMYDNPREDFLDKPSPPKIRKTPVPNHSQPKHVSPDTIHNSTSIPRYQNKEARPLSHQLQNTPLAWNTPPCNQTQILTTPNSTNQHRNI